HSAHLVIQFALISNLFAYSVFRNFTTVSSIRLIQITFGKPMRDAWPKPICDIFSTRLEEVRTTRKGFFIKDEFFEVPRVGYTQEGYFTTSYSPIFKSDGTICAILDIAQETTQNILNTRRLKTLSEFGKRVPEIESLESVCHIMTDVLSNNIDISYALIYFVEHKLNASLESLIARLISTTFDKDGKDERDIPDYLPETPEIVYLAEDVNKNCDTYIELKQDADLKYIRTTCVTHMHKNLKSQTPVNSWSAKFNNINAG
ncbi:13120_t:CDS:2, partial [Dentiscutata heterogama]